MQHQTWKCWSFNSCVVKLTMENRCFAVRNWAKTRILLRVSRNLDDAEFRKGGFDDDSEFSVTERKICMGGLMAGNAPQGRSYSPDHRFFTQHHERESTNQLKVNGLQHRICHENLIVFCIGHHLYRRRQLTGTNAKHLRNQTDSYPTTYFPPPTQTQPSLPIHIVLL